jgi:hypothetical protein
MSEAIAIGRCDSHCPSAAPARNIPRTCFADIAAECPQLAFFKAHDANSTVICQRPSETGKRHGQTQNDCAQEDRAGKNVNSAG